MTRILVTVLAGGVLAGILGFWLLPVLRALKAGQSIREVGPTWHNYKAGTLLGTYHLFTLDDMWLQFPVPILGYFHHSRKHAA